MAEWIYEEGIGENRAILVENGEIVEAAIELPSALRAGAVVEARLTSIVIAATRGLAATAGDELLIEPLPAALTEGSLFRAEVVREAISEAGRLKRALARASDKALCDGLTLADRLPAFSRLAPTESDRFEEAGWSELLDEAETGQIDFSGGSLRLSLTPAMTLIDIDGSLSTEALAEAGAAAAARAIRRHGLTGSIGIDLPTVSKRDLRQRAAAAVDSLLPQPFERTAVNGFGFLQIIRRRERASIPEIIRSDPVGAAARALLRRAEWTGGHGPLLLHAAPPVLARIEVQPDWTERLERRLGAPAVLQPDPALAISAGHAHRRQA